MQQNAILCHALKCNRNEMQRTATQCNTIRCGQTCVCDAPCQSQDSPAQRPQDTVFNCSHS
eukprot:5584469-Lingulodinium_polyedra.AAC.1